MMCYCRALVSWGIVMNRIFLALLLSALCAEAAESADPRLAQLAERQLGKDFRIVFRLEKNASICGGTGDAYIGDVEVNRPHREVAADGSVKLADNWMPIGKTYSIFAEELGFGQAALMDADNCLVEERHDDLACRRIHRASSARLFAVVGALSKHGWASASERRSRSDP